MYIYISILIFLIYSKFCPKMHRCDFFENHLELYMCRNNVFLNVIEISATLFKTLCSFSYILFRWLKNSFHGIISVWILVELDINESRVPNGMHSQMLRDLKYILERPLSIIFDLLWPLGEVLKGWRQQMSLLCWSQVRRMAQGTTGFSASSQSLEKEDGKLILKIMSRHSKDRQTIRSSQCGYTKRKSCLTNLINFFDQVAVLVDTVRAEAVVYLSCSSACDTLTYDVDEQAVR